MSKYTTDGMVDGCCGHSHPTMRSALACVHKYRKRHPYSDRTVRRVVNKRPQLLDVYESIALTRMEKER